MTVSRVVNGSSLVSPATRHRVERAMRELAYIPNHAARSLVIKKLGVLALMIPDLSNPFWPLLVRGAEEAVRTAGYTIVLGNSDERFDKEDAYLRAVCSLGVDGVVLAPSGDKSRHSLELLQRQQIPFVLVDRGVDGAACDVVRGESRRAARKLTEHLLAHGHRRIGLISGPTDISTANDRERGYVEALESVGVAHDQRHVRRTSYTRVGGRFEALTLLGQTERPTAVVTANNFLAFGVIDATRELGLRVPDDVAIVTFDDVEIVAEEPILTCAAQHAEAIGRAAIEQLVARLGGDRSPKREIVLETELRIRRSCGCRPDALVTRDQ
jgi:LacI family transcriptional regulator